MKNVLEVKNLKKSFFNGKTEIDAVKDVSFKLKKGEVLGLVGESGCGKSTIANMVTRLIAADEGGIFLNGEDITKSSCVKNKNIYKNIQMVFQSPAESFNPRKTIGSGIIESMINSGISRKDSLKRGRELLILCGLDPEYINRYPHEISGGECQRAAIARAIAIKPAVIICDEATSALDVTVQKQIIELLKRLRHEFDISFLFICHDLALVQEFSNRVLVMYQGKIIEEGSTDSIIKNPQKEYTKILINSVL